MTDIHMETPGVRGHTRSTWRDVTHLRGMLLMLIAEHPDASRDELEGFYLAKAEMVPALVEEALRRAFDNDLAQIDKAPRPRKPPQPVSEDAIAEAVEKIKTIVLLDLVQPNGKKLRDCTGAEVRELAAQMPSWLKAIAAKVKPGEIVGQVLSEADLRKMWDK
jgi:hypothetical protein